MVVSRVAAQAGADLLSKGRAATLERLVIHRFISKTALYRVGLLALAAGYALTSASIAETPAPGGSVPPPWAYAVDPPGVVAPKDDGTLRHVPDSPLAMTLSQVRDGYVSPDWHPDDHPVMPEIVVHGRKPEVMACGYCHRAEGTGGPENTSLAGLPATYIIQQMADLSLIHI